MKRRRNPEVPAPVIALACFAAGGALAWWLTRSSAPALPVPNAFVPAPRPIENREGVILPTPEEQAAIDLYNAQLRNGATPVGPGANAIIGAVLAGGRTSEAEQAAALERIRSGGSRQYIA